MVINLVSNLEGFVPWNTLAWCTVYPGLTHRNFINLKLTVFPSGTTEILKKILNYFLFMHNIKSSAEIEIIYGILVLFHYKFVNSQYKTLFCNHFFLKSFEIDLTDVFRSTTTIWFMLLMNKIPFYYKKVLP